MKLDVENKFDVLYLIIYVFAAWRKLKTNSKAYSYIFKIFHMSKF